jgi:hypothetical protein
MWARVVESQAAEQKAPKRHARHGSPQLIICLGKVGDVELHGRNRLNEGDASQIIANYICRVW